MKRNLSSVRAVIFDLDGTLIDSMGIWQEIDEEFFARRGMPVPPGYQERIAHLGFSESAVVTAEEYLPGESAAALAAEWRQMAREKYGAADGARHFKPGAIGFLRALHAAGFRLGVATASSPELSVPVLRAGGVWELFGAFASVEEAGRNKSFPDVFLLCGEKLGVSPGQCAVFEDNLTALRSAKAAGMFAVGVFDRSSEGFFAQIREEADAFIHDFSEAMRAFGLR